ncbi:MAG: uncharacterized protein QOG67_35 [Verrucomicrobiota bacterium]|jgi:predicted CoA-binding protein
MVVVLGASPRPERYAFRAMQMLTDYGHTVIPVNPAYDEVLGLKCFRSVADVTAEIGTITLYLGKARSDPLIEEIVGKKPGRIIMNPGAENENLTLAARKQDIEVIEGCTLVMLSVGTF